MDQLLDIVVSPDRSRWTWKDEEEFLEAQARGPVSPEKAGEIRAEGERIIELMRAGRPPFSPEIKTYPHHKHIGPADELAPSAQPTLSTVTWGAEVAAKVGGEVVHIFPNPRGEFEEGQYDVLLGHRLLEQTGQLLRERGLSGRVAVVTDTTVGPLHAARVLDGLAAAGLNGLTVEVPAGEAHKTLETVRQLYDAFLDAGLDRGDTVLALGGGVVGDTTGFAAATYMRGLPLVQAPTTLLAMVDASIGGKVGVDLPQGKNLVGAFKQPALTVADLSVLATLPAVELRAGLAEIVKHAIIADPGLFEMLSTGLWPAYDRASQMDVVARAIAVKVAIVTEDPYESGRRMVLNLGHTFAHALEACSGYAMRHGEAVAVGLVAAARLAVSLGLCDAILARRVEALLRKIGLPTTYRGPAPEILWTAMAVDKKRLGGRPRFVLPEAIGRVVVRDDVPQEPVLQVLEELREEG